MPERINRIHDKLEQASAYPDDHAKLGEAAAVACQTTKWLIEDEGFRRDLQTLEEMKGRNFDRASALLERAQDFEQFLSVEKDLLLRSGLREDVVLPLIDDCRRIRNSHVDVNQSPQSIRSGVLKQSPQQIIGALRKLKDATCNVSVAEMDVSKGIAQQKSIILCLSGGVLVSVNVAGVLAVLTAPAATLSGIIGGALITKGLG